MLNVFIPSFLLLKITNKIIISIIYFSKKRLTLHLVSYIFISFHLIWSDTPYSILGSMLVGCSRSKPEIFLGYS